MTSTGKAALWVIMASATTTVMAGSIIAPVLNVMGQGLGVDPGSARIIITTHGIIIALSSPLFGLIIDRAGVRRPFILGLLLYGLAGGSGILITDYWLLIASRVLLGIGVAAVFTSNTVIILNLYQGSLRNRVMGWRGSFNSVGGVIWPLLGGFLGTFSWHLPFAAYLIGLPLALFALLTIPETGRAQTGIPRPGESHGSLFGIFRETRVLFIIYGLMLLMNIFLYAIVVFLPYLLEEFNITNTFYVGIFLAVPTIFGGVASFLYGRIRSRLSYRAIVIICLALWTTGFMLISRAASIPVLAIAIALFGLGLGMLMPAIPVWAGEMVPVSFRGRIVSYIATFGYVGQFLSPIMLSPIATSLGMNSLFLGLGGTCAMIFMLFAALFRQPEGSRAAK